MRFMVFIMALSLSAVISPAAPASVADAAPGIEVRSVSIYFENRRPEITVSRTDTAVRANADVATTGSGPLEGYWEMDGRVVARMSRHITGVGGTTLTTYESPVLPTGTPGSHVVRFVVTNPPTISPTALLFIVPEGAPSGFGSLALLQPSEDASMDYAGLTFTWEGLSDSVTYLISFHRSARGKPVFAAYTQSTSYTLPEQALRKYFRPGKRYFWRVSCFDSSGHAACIPKRQVFGFKR